MFNAYPRVEVNGIEDLSGRALQPEPLLLPTHLPLFYDYCERGRLRPTLLSGDRAVRLFGQKSFLLDSIYATHQTLFMNQARGNGNAVFLKRLQPADAKPPAGICLYLDLLATEVVQYQRNPDGSYLLDPNTQQPLPVLSGGNPVKIAGYTAQWLLGPLPQYNAEGDIITAEMIDDATGPTDPTIIPVENAIGQQSVTAGSRSDVTIGSSSVRYPIMEFEADSFGEWGNNVAFSLMALTKKTNPQVNEDVVAANKAFMYRLQFLERDDSSSTAKVVRTIFGEQGLEFAFKDRARNQFNNQDLFIGTRFPKAWTSTLDPIDPTYGPVNRHHIYYNNIETISDTIATSENVRDPSVSTADEDRYLINLIDGRNVLGNHYVTYQVLGTAGGGINLNSVAKHYLRNGSDGTMNFTEHDKLVRYELANFGDTGAPLRNTALFPISSLWDSGFSLQTKYAMMVPLGVRKDIVIHLCDQDLSQPTNTASQASSACEALYNAVRNFPESEVYGTAVCRATIFKGSDELITSTWRGVNGRMAVPYNLELLNKVSKFMGSGTGIWDTNLRFTRSPNNIITMFRNSDLDSLVQSADVRTVDWANGCMWVEPFDMRSTFIPAFQTVYDNDTSVLNSLPMVYACVDLWKVMERVWRELTGEDKYTNAQFIKKSNQLLITYTTGKYDGILVQPDTMFTSIDENNGFSWTTVVRVGGEVPKTYNKLKIESWRMSDLNLTADSTLG